MLSLVADELSVQPMTTLDLEARRAEKQASRDEDQLVREEIADLRVLIDAIPEYLRATGYAVQHARRMRALMKKLASENAFLDTEWAMPRWDLATDEM